MDRTFPTFAELYQLASDYLKDLPNSKLTDFNEGSVIDANIGISATVGGELVYQLIRLLRAFYVSTAEDEDLDNRLKDYNIIRKPALYASGLLTLTRTETSSALLISAGTTFKCSSDGTEFYNEKDIVFNSGQSVVTDVSVIAAEYGEQGNVLANAIDTIVPTPINSINITHPTFTNGLDEETNDELRVRFYLELSNMARGTKPAILVGALRHIGVSNAAHEKIFSGYNRLYISTGQGSPSDTLIKEVQKDLEDNWVSAGEQIEVVGAQTNDVNISGTIYLTADAATDIEKLINVIKTQIGIFFTTKEMGDPIYKAELIKLIMSVKGVVNIILDMPDIIPGQASKIQRVGVITLVPAA